MIDIRIAIFTDSYKPQINGLVRSTELFTKYLRKLGHEVHIFAPTVKDYKEKDKFVHRFNSIEFLPYPEYKIAFPISLFFSDLFKNKKFDVIHIQSPFSMGVIGLYVGHHYKIPIIATYHTNYQDYLHYFVKPKEIEEILKPAAKRIAWKYLKYFFNKCNYVIAPTQYVKKNLLREGIKNIFVIPTGVEIKKNNKSKIELREKYKFEYKDKIILHVGRVTKEKNIEMIIRAVKELGNEYRLIITSDGPYKKELMKEKYKNIIFTGYLSEEKLKDYYKLSDVFVMASKTETQGLVLLEAVVNDLPVVVINAPVISDFVKETKIGLVTNNLSKSIKDLINNKKMQEDIKDNRKNVIKNYDIRKCTKKLLNLYKLTIKNCSN